LGVGGLAFDLSAGRTSQGAQTRRQTINNQRRFHLAAPAPSVLKSVMPPPAAPLPATLPKPAPPPGLPDVHLAAYEGPMGVLLHLVRAGRMDIFDLPIATLCDQFLAYLRALEEMDLAVAGEFIVMAATLLEIKSRLLLPPPPRPEGEEGDEGGSDDGDVADPRAELVRRLLEYGKYQSIAENLRASEGARLQLFFRQPTEYKGQFAIPPRFGELSADQLLRTLEKMLAASGDGERAITSIRRRKITLRMTMRSVAAYAENAGADGVTLAELLPPAPFELFEVVLLFLALLELLKAGTVLVAQEAFCGEIRVFFVPERDRAALWGDDEAGTQFANQSDAPTTRKGHREIIANAYAD